nr:PREDICTED: B- and T-lymphocyte attenuator-like [Lepisosteus oculatus]
MFLPERRVILELMLLLSVSSQVQGKESECALEVVVPRNSVLNISALRRLTLNCGLKYCEEKPVVRWCKLHEKACIPVKEAGMITTEWKEKDPNSATYSLTFSNITLGDSGQYRCEAAANVSSVYQSTVSHSILVSVSGKENECTLEVLVPRNSIWNISALRRLTITCGIKYCEEKPVVRWCKFHEKACIPVKEAGMITTEWKEKDPNSATYSLTFSNITLGDSGHYRCEAAANVSSVYQSTVSHSILVSVSGE